MAGITIAPAEAGYVSFDPPTSGFTMPLSINDKGAISGYWFDGNLYHGFLRTPDGTITTFDPPGSVETTPLGMNDYGLVVGAYKAIKNEYGFYHGFVRHTNGDIVTYDTPENNVYTAIKAINRKKTMTGYYTDKTEGRYHGFVLDAAGNFASFDPPTSVETWAWDINDEGTVTGYYIYAGNGPCGNGILGGFTRTPNGKITTFDVEAGASPTGINSRNVIGGQYTDESCHENGFVRQADGHITTFGYAGTTCCTYTRDINKQGSVVGSFYDANDREHGFLRTPKGKFIMIQPDGPPDMGSAAVGINNSGQIAGWYTDDTGLHGFLYTP